MARGKNENLCPSDLQLQNVKLPWGKNTLTYPALEFVHVPYVYVYVTTRNIGKREGLFIGALARAGALRRESNALVRPEINPIPCALRAHLAFK